MIHCLTQKIELNYVIPAIRMEIIENLNSKGLNDAEIAKKLKITKSAISQYKHKKRGKEIVFSKEIQKDILSASKKISKDYGANAEISKIIDKLKKTRCMCKICKECGK